MKASEVSFRLGEIVPESKFSLHGVFSALATGVLHCFIMRTMYRYGPGERCMDIQTTSFGSDGMARNSAVLSLEDGC